MREFLLRLLNKRIPLCNVTKKTLKNCISTILQGQILRLDTLGLVGYFTSLEDISLCPLTICVMGHTTTFSKGANPTACQTLSNPHIIQIPLWKLNKICFLLKCEKSHKFKVLLYAVKQKRPRRTVFLQFSKVDFYVWTLWGWLAILPL